MANAPAKPPQRRDDVDDPQQLAAQFDLVQRELQRMDRRLAALESALVEAQQAAATVKALAELSGPQETLLPIGGGVHVAAKVDPSASVLLPIGGGYFTEGAPAKVATALEQRVASITQSFQEASADAERLAQAAASINARLGEFSS